MTVSKRCTSTSGNSPASSDQPRTDTDGVEVEDFGLEFDPPSPSTNAVSTNPTAPPIANVAESVPASVIWHLSLNDGRQEGPLLTEEIRLRLANGTLLADSLIWRPGMPKWEPVNSVPEFQTAPISADTNSWQFPNELMDWAHLSLIASGALLVVSVLGGYWGYSWFTGALLFFLGYLIGRGFAQVFEMLSGIEARLSSSARGTDQHD